MALSRNGDPWYGCCMTPKLTPELSQALAQQRGQPLQVEDPLTHDRYILVQLDVYEHLQQAMDCDAKLKPRSARVLPRIR